MNAMTTARLKLKTDIFPEEIILLFMAKVFLWFVNADAWALSVSGPFSDTRWKPVIFIIDNSREHPVSLMDINPPQSS